MAAPLPLTRPLGVVEAARFAGFTHESVITADNLDQATANTAQTVLLANLAVGDVIVKAGWVLKTAFKDASDTAFNSDTISFGDTSNVALFIAAFEVNENGTEIFYKFTNTAVGPYTATNSLNATINSMAAKSLTNIDTGELHFYFQLLRMADLAAASSGAILTVTK